MAARRMLWAGAPAAQVCMTQVERRRDRRQDIQLPVEVRWLDPRGRPVVLHTHTRNVSTSGFYFETDLPDLAPTLEFDVELRIPPGGGVSAFESLATTVGEVLRVDDLGVRTPGGVRRYGVGARFRERPRIRF